MISSWEPNGAKGPSRLQIAPSLLEARHGEAGLERWSGGLGVYDASILAGVMFIFLCRHSIIVEVHHTVVLLVIGS